MFDWVLNTPLPHNLIFELFRDMFMQFTIMSMHYLNINNSTEKLRAIKPNQKQWKGIKASIWNLIKGGITSYSGGYWLQIIYVSFGSYKSFYSIFKISLLHLVLCMDVLILFQWHCKNMEIIQMRLNKIKRRMIYI